MPAQLRAASPRAILLAFVIGDLAIAIDQITKALAVHRLAGRPPKHVIGDLLQFELARNPGAAFSTGTSHTEIFSVIAIIATVVVWWFIVRTRSLGWACALGLLFAGIVGNLIDRIFREPGVFRGHVVDFIALPHWPIFNVADMCINVAAVLIVILAVRGIRLDGSTSN
jgi:signal peptidase II